MWSARKRSRAPAGNAETSSPNTSTTPRLGATTPPTKDSKVLLPLPLGPSMNTRSPGAMAASPIASTGGLAPYA